VYICTKRAIYCYKTLWLVVQNAVAHASRLSAAKMTNDILHGIYDLDFLATHSLIGSREKRPLPVDVVNRIIGKLLHIKLQ